MNKITKRPALFGLLTVLTEPYLAALFVTLVANLPAGLLGLDSESTQILQAAANICFVLLLTVPMRKWIVNGSYLGFGSRGLRAGCMLLLPMLLELGLYMLGGHGARLLSGDLSAKTVLLCLFAGISPGLTEEVIFRGWILGNMLVYWREKKWGIPAALAVSSLLFSLAHIYNLMAGQSLIATVNQLLFTLAMGSIMGASYSRCRNLLAPVLFHSFHDVVGLLLLQATGGSAGGSSINWLQTGLYVLIIFYSFCLIRPAKQADIRQLWSEVSE